MDRAVLLVDDDENLLAGLVRTLRKQPFQTYTAHNGQDAIWILKTHEIDVIVADERMPGMSGSDLLSWVVDNCPDVMRIVLTGHADVDTAIRAINEAGVCRFFVKPCNEARLAIAIRKAIEQKDAKDNDRRALETVQQQLRETEGIRQDLQFQTHIASEDLQRPLERILDGCRRLEEQSVERLDGEARGVLADVRDAAAEAQRLIAHLQNAGA